MEPDTQVPSAPTVPRRVVRYDFRRPDKFSRDQIRTMAIMHETFARQTTTVLSAQLRCMAHVHVASVDQLTYEEFIRSIPNPCTMAIVAMDPLNGSAVLEFDPSLGSAIVDRLFGGPCRALEPYRQFTDIESTVVESVLARVIANLSNAWGAVTDLQPRLSRIECNPMFAQVVPPSEMVVLVTLECTIGDAVGMINFCVPYLTIEPIIPRLSAQYVYSHARTGPPRQARFPVVSTLPVPAEIGYEGERISLGALSRLKKGALIAIPQYGEGRAFLQAGGAAILDLKRGPRGAQSSLYAVIEHRISKSLESLSATVAKGAGEKGQDALENAVRSYSAEVGAAMKSIDARITDLATRQEELADQLIFESPDSDVGTGGNRAQKRPFGSYSVADCDVLAPFLGQEHPQLIAMVLSYLEPGLAACVLSRVPENLRTDVAERICMIDRVSPRVLHDVDRVLEKKLSLLSSAEYAAAGGVQAAVEILNMASRSLEKGVIDALEKSNPRIADEIKKRMFVFEDITLLDRETVARVLKEVADDDLLLALKVTPEEVRAFVWECVPPESASRLKGLLEKSGRARLRDVEAAQQRILGVLRRMDEEGTVVIVRPGETIG